MLILQEIIEYFSIRNTLFQKKSFSSIWGSKFVLVNLFSINVFSNKMVFCLFIFNAFCHIISSLLRVMNRIVLNLKMAHRKRMLVITCPETNPYKLIYHDILLEFET